MASPDNLVPSSSNNNTKDLVRSSRRDTLRRVLRAVLRAHAGPTMPLTPEQVGSLAKSATESLMSVLSQWSMEDRQSTIDMLFPPNLYDCIITRLALAAEKDELTSVQWENLSIIEAAAPRPGPAMSAMIKHLTDAARVGELTQDEQEALERVIQTAESERKAVE